jgi:hypothetical protein
VLTPNFVIDWTQLRIAMGLRLMDSRLSVREAAQLAGVAPSAISRVNKEREQGAANVLALCKWLGLDPLNLLIDTRDGGVSADVRRETPSETEADQ